MAKDNRTDLQKFQETSLADMVFLDTETTGFGEAAEAVSFALLTYEGEGTYKLIKPCYTPDNSFSWAKAAEINKITPDKVADAEGMCAYAADIRKAVRGTATVAWNMPFDREFFYDKLSSSKTQICLMRAYKEYMGRSKWSKLTVAAKELFVELPDGEAHGAEWDTAVLRLVAIAFKNQLDKDEENITDIL